MRALVSGATGFLGNLLVLELRRLKWEVICLVRKPVQHDDGGIRCFPCDLLRSDIPDGGAGELGTVDVVFHLAAQLPDASVTDDAVYFRANALGTARMLRLAGDLKAPSFVYVSSVGIIGKPEIIPVSETHPVRVKHPYHAGKFAGELFCEMVRESERRKIVSLRIASPYGPGMAPATVLPYFIGCVLRSEDLLWFGSGERTQNFIHSSDVVHACLLAAQTGQPGVYNIGGESSVNMRDLAGLIVDLCPGCRSAARAAGKPDPQEDERWELDLSRAKAGLGYSPLVTLREGLRDLIAFVRSKAPVPQWWRAGS
jgi:nucleoside-diphosphate-sugar epimerase